MFFKVAPTVCQCCLKMAYKQNDNQQIFDEIATKFTQLLYGPKDGDKNRILKALDNLNALDYRYVFVTNSTVST